MWMLLLFLLPPVASECGYYLAPSTIPGAGLGMYAGKDVARGDRVTYGDPIVPLLDINWHNGNEDFYWLWGEYTWEFSQESGKSGAITKAASPGFGSVPNCMVGLINTELAAPQRGSGGLHRSRDPGAGAFTPYHDRAATATRPIHAGDEFFVDYGDHYFTLREKAYGQVPVRSSYKLADKLLERFGRFYDRVLKDTYTWQLKNDLWAIMTSLDARTINALPKNLTDTPKALTTGTGRLYEDRSRRSLKWLAKHGKCMDNIRNGNSAIPQAGRGAFATRRIKKGGLVAPAPLIHIPDKKTTIIYDTMSMTGPIHEDENYMRRNASAPIHSQLLMNYCFGHPKSDVLLCPYGVVVSLVNHSPTAANTKIVWSNSMRHSEWFEKPPKTMEEALHTGLSFDFVALRNIELGEEILIDYGPEWQAAWDDHVRSWKPPVGARKYIESYLLNDVYVDLRLPTIAEGGFPDHLIVWIHGGYMELAGYGPAPEFVRAQILDRHVGKYGEYRYRVQSFEAEDNLDAKTTIRLGPMMWSLPRDAFYFKDSPYSRDHEMPWSFRHYIGIPDEIFPDVWKRPEAITTPSAMSMPGNKTESTECGSVV